MCTGFDAATAVTTLVVDCGVVVVAVVAPATVVEPAGRVISAAFTEVPVPDEQLAATRTSGPRHENTTSVDPDMTWCKESPWEGARAAVRIFFVFL